MSWKGRVARIANNFLQRYDVQIISHDYWRPWKYGGQPELMQAAVEPPRQPFFKVFEGKSVGAAQRPFDFAVVMPSILRATIGDAMRSIFSQQEPGRVQILIGVDKPLGDAGIIDEICAEIPPHQAVYLFYPGYSTSRRHGGLHPSWDGGTLRTVLTYLANSRYVAYLDDDNWWAPTHLATIRRALEGHDWAYSRRWFVHPTSRRPICEDIWESVGPGQGVFLDKGGWVDPNCIAIDKLACEAVVRWWSIPGRKSIKYMDADRNVFQILCTEFRGRPTNEATVYYALDESDERHPMRVEAIGADRYREYLASPQT
jgi:hypothetical protein